jgi:ribonuclease-3
MKSGGHRRDSILADALEAVVAAIYLDAGFETCRAVVLPWFEDLLAALPEGKPEKDAKTRLQEWLQARQRPLPLYELVSESGDDHAKQFQVRCSLQEPPVAAEGEGTSRRIAEQAAAAAVLGQLAEPKRSHAR